MTNPTGTPVTAGPGGTRGGPPPPSIRALPRYPSLLEINTRVWLAALSRRAGKPFTLADVDDTTLDGFADRGFDWIWLLSVWRTGPASRAVSRNNQAWRVGFKAVLPDLMDEDICGSGFAVAAYEVAEALGGGAALAAFRARLAQRGLRLMLDFVPNHTGLDHVWAKAHPDFYVQGTESDLAAAPDSYCRLETDHGGRILAHGRDPNFPAWPDTLQLDHANPALQKALTEQLVSVAGQCDAVRCDMAMLLLPHIVAQTWGRASPPFWPDALRAVRRTYPGYCFLAEAYWDLEWELQQQGFDWCYDKRLYDRLRGDDTGALRAHLTAGLDYQDRLARFLENHDEPRAAATFPWPRHQAAAILTYLAPGLRFFQGGQREGAVIHVPVHLCRGPEERDHRDIAAFYDKLLGLLKTGETFRDGAWSSIAPEPAWNGNASADAFVAYAWHAPGIAPYLIAVNYSDHRAQCRLRLPLGGLAGTRVRLTDEMGSEVYERDGNEMIDPGLYVDLEAWRYNVFRLTS
jgi:hypothetical protein